MDDDNGPGIPAANIGKTDLVALAKTNPKTAEEIARLEDLLELVRVKQGDFLVSTYRSGGGPPRSDVFALLSMPCEIKFGYIERDTIEADVTLLAPSRDVFSPDEFILMRFVNGVWEIANP